MIWKFIKADVYQKAKNEYYRYFDLYRKFNSMYNKQYVKEKIKKYGMYNTPKEKNNYLGLSLLTN